MNSGTDGGEVERMHGRARGALTIVLVVVACISTLTSMLGLWGQRTFLNTDKFTSRVEALAKDPAVVAAMTAELTEQVMELVDLNSFFEDVAPNHGRSLAIVLSRPMRTFVSQTITSFVESDRFQEIFVEVVRRAHAAALRLLKGERLLVFSPPGRVTMNIVPMIAKVLEKILEVSPGLLPVHDQLPDLSGDEPAATSIAKLRSALHLPPDAKFGQMQLSDIDQLSSARRIYQVYQRSLVVSLLITVVSIGGAIALSRRRRATVVALSLGLAGSLVLLRRATFVLRDELVSRPVTALRSDAMAAVLDELLRSLFVASGIVVAVLLVTALLAFVTSPWRWAVALRAGTVPWISDHRVPLQWAGGVGVVLLLALFDLGGWGILLAGLAVVGYELAVGSVGRTPATPATPPG
jgi:hypothetical protein